VSDVVDVAGGGAAGDWDFGGILCGFAASDL